MRSVPVLLDMCAYETPEAGLAHRTIHIVIHRFIHSFLPRDRELIDLPCCSIQPQQTLASDESLPEDEARRAQSPDVRRFHQDPAPAAKLPEWNAHGPGIDRERALILQ